MTAAGGTPPDRSRAPARALRVLFAAGGTGGHLVPALAAADALVTLRPDAECLFLTSGRGVDDRFFERSTLRRESLFPSLDTAPSKRDVAAWIGAFRRARRTIVAFDPDVIVGVGGYPTGIAGTASLGGGIVGPLRVLLGRPRSRPKLVLLEQNAVAGRAVRLLGRVASRILWALPIASDERFAGKSEWIGNPLPRSFSVPPPPIDFASFGLEPGRPTLVCLGGSQGARAVNRLVLAARERLGRQVDGLQILLVTGDKEAAGVRAALVGANRPRTVVAAFVDRMRELYEVADVIVARAGGTTLSEVAIAGRPLVLVPYPHHRDRHQFENANVFARVGAASIVEEGQGDVDRFVEAVGRWFADAEARGSAADAARAIGRADAARRCAERILEVAERSR